MISASFFDPNSNGFDIGDGSVILGATLALFGVILAVRKATQALGEWISETLRDMISKEIKSGRHEFAAEVSHLTKPIQPGGNGGSSLTDSNKKLDLIALHLGIEFPDALKADH